ncbi:MULTISPECIES: hypothetical protein [unclassified Streptomyces]|uniref:hypothetical protein n=1 Tax=unclassified Streptomyces TaxID=2593676 RepID=UPI0034069FF6
MTWSAAGPVEREVEEQAPVAVGQGAYEVVLLAESFIPRSPDVRPLHGAVPRVGGLIVANGLGASGLMMGPYAGAVAARLTRRADPGIDLTP